MHVDNKNLRNYSNNCNKNKWQFILIGDKKTPYIQMPFGEYFNLERQKKLNLHFAKVCPENNYARKNVGYLIAMRDNDVIIETDDDNYPKSNFFLSLHMSCVWTHSHELRMPQSRV